MRRLFLVLICVISCGCRNEAQPPDDRAAQAKPQAAVKLSVMVIEDAELAKGIELLAGEWSERSGGELIVKESSLDDLLAAERPAADVLIYPSRQLGELVTRDWLRPVRPSVIEDPTLAWSDFLPAIRDQSVRYGGQVYALPLGEIPLVLDWQGELPKVLPTTCDQFAESGVVAKPSDGSPFPLTREFLARALAATAPADRASLFFEPRTMDARLKTPQMVQALEWLKDSAQKSNGSSASVVLPRGVDQANLTPLLVADRVYNVSLDRWDVAETSAPPVVLGFAGRLVSVTTATRNAASAFKLIPWLTSGSTGTSLSQRSLHTLWYRMSQASQAAKWLQSSSGEDDASWLTGQLSRSDAYLLPRIPGIDRYLAALEAALRDSLSGDVPAGRTLAAAESQWDTITDSLGREQQQVSFNRHLGLSQ